jgi:hypothetical protein
VAAGAKASRRWASSYRVPVCSLCVSVEDGLAYFQAHPAEVKRLMGTYLDHMAAAA